jgi:hypothetical protein
MRMTRMAVPATNWPNAKDTIHATMSRSTRMSCGITVVLQRWYSGLSVPRRSSGWALQLR